MTYYEALEAEESESDPLGDWEFAVFWPRIHSGTHRGPWPGTEGLEQCKVWIAECVEEGFQPGAFIIRERRINEWRDIDV